MTGSYYEIFASKMKKCKSKKDYKKLCKEMLYQFDAVDHIDENMWKIFSSTIGEDVYTDAMSAAIKMYILEKQGIICDILSIEKDTSK